MARLRKFELEGEALIVTGRLNNEGKPSYSIELKNIGALTSEELLEFAKALSHDAEAWEGILHRFPEEQFTYSVIAKFEKAWGGKADGVRMQAVPKSECDGCGRCDDWGHGYGNTRNPYDDDTGNPFEIDYKDEER